LGRFDGIYYDVLMDLIWEFTGEMVIDSQLNGIDHGDILGIQWDVDYPQIFGCVYDPTSKFHRENED
jgi:hypothetical protein